MMSCKEVEATLLSYLYDELSREERAVYDAHLAACADCRRALEDSRRLHQVLGVRSAPEPTPELIVRCRQALDEALDREQLGWRGLIRNLVPVLSGLHPSAQGAVAVLTLVLFGFGLGWTLRPRSEPLPRESKPAPPVALASADLGNERISDISQVSPDPKTGDVRITLNAERRVTLEGSLDNPRIQQLLVGTVKGYENAGIRRDSLDVLSTRSGDPAVREALLYVMRHDPNVGVRLEAVSTVRGMEWGADVEQALLEAAEREKNSGVRFAAINTLADHVVKVRDKGLLPKLEGLASMDPDRYVRMKCAVAVHELAGDSP